MSELEPRIWSHITDALPDEHPLAYKTLYCSACREMVHCGNNECMSTWVETGKGPYCIACFLQAIKSVSPADQVTIQGRTFDRPEQTCYLMDESEGWGLK